MIKYGRLRLNSEVCTEDHRGFNKDTIEKTIFNKKA